MKSAACRHAIRLAVGIAIGEVVASVLGLSRPYWLPMTIALILKPEYASTISRGFTRVLGTFLGLVIATVLFHVFRSNAGVDIFLLAIFMFVLRWIGSANYGIFAMAVGGVVVMMNAIAGVPPYEVILARGVDTALGGVIAMSIYWIWPTWEKRLVPEVVARMLDAYRGYFKQVSRFCVLQDEGCDPASLDRARNDGRIGRSNLQASLARLRIEPGTSDSQRLLLDRILATSNRFAHACMALEAMGPQDLSAPGRQAYADFARDIEAALAALSERLRGNRFYSKDLPDLRESFDRFNSADGAGLAPLVRAEADRLTNCLNTLLDQISHLSNERSQLPS